MKTKIGILAVVAVFAFAGMQSIDAQRFQRFQHDQKKPYVGQRIADKICKHIPDLTDEQEKKISDLRVAHMDEMTEYRAQVREHQAHLKALEIADDPDMQEINTTIEEIGQVRIQMQKARAQLHQDIRELLTEEQRTFFDHFRNSRTHKMQQRHLDGPSGAKGQCGEYRRGMHFQKQ